MSIMPVMPQDREWTVDDLADLPQDGLQYELADGILLVSPSPLVPHQRVISRLHVLLSQACPADLEVFVAPLDFQPTRTRSLQPDLLVVPRIQATGPKLTGTLSLAVEVLSASTRSKDLLLKPGLYAESGVQSYWVVDPIAVSIEAWRLMAGAYVQVGLAVGAETLMLAEPFAVGVRPDLLVDRQQ